MVSSNITKYVNSYISVICKSCNASIRNSAITKKLNNDLVKEIWNSLRYDERNGKLLEKKNHNL